MYNDVVLYRRLRCRLFPVVLNIIFCCLVIELLVRFTTGHFLITLRLIHRVQRITMPLSAAGNSMEQTSYPKQLNNSINLARIVANDATKTPKEVDPKTSHSSETFIDGFSSLEMALEKVGTSKREIILIHTSHSLIHFTNNFVKINQHLGNGVKSYLFVSDNSSVCTELLKENIPCWTYAKLTKFEGQSTHFTALSALKLNYTVQIIEYDVVLVWNTLCHLAEKCPLKSCEVAASTKENGKSNDGAVLYLHPTPGAIAFMECLSEQYQRTKLHNKIGSCSDKAWRKSQGFEVHHLSEMEYARGYFHLDEKSQVKAACVNRNWDPVEAIYFMKESEMWFMEKDDYFSAAQKYITYNNDWLKAFKDPSSVGKEKDALKNAFVLGDILNRTLILPTFHCWWYGYNCLVTMVASPITVSKLPYRESSFLSNTRTHQKVKQDQSKWYIADNTETYTDHLISLDIFGRKQSKSDDVVHLRAANIEHVTKEEVLEWLGGVNSTVLRMLSTYGMDLCQGDKSISKVCGMF